MQFILNQQTVTTSLEEGSTVLDFVRYHKRLTGTKIGCREGDCGACTVLVGDFENKQLVYRSMTSCLMPLANAVGKHIVTVEGINMEKLSLVQQAMLDSNGTQCGFCTLGFVMSFTGFVMHPTWTQYEEAISSIDGNICRCTGYKSIERAAEQISQQLQAKPKENTLEWLVKKQYIPDYFLQIPSRLLAIKSSLQAEKTQASSEKMNIGGGTDLIVQKHHAVKHSPLNKLFGEKTLQGISKNGKFCEIGGATTVTTFAESPIIQSIFPNLAKHIKLVSSTPIRNMATLAGNFANASPIGDMTIFFLALNANIVLKNGEARRTVALKDFYKGYKILDKTPEEIIEKIQFVVPSKNAVFNFEKVSKRTYLDIASVNSAFYAELDEQHRIAELHISAGGVAPFPTYLSATREFLLGKTLDEATIEAAISVINKEIAPISDARGTATYKRLLLRQLFLLHIDNLRLVENI